MSYMYSSWSHLCVVDAACVVGHVLIWMISGAHIHVIDSVWLVKLAVYDSCVWYS